MNQPGAGQQRGGGKNAGRLLIALAAALAVLAIYFIVGENEPRHTAAGLLLLFCSLVALALGLGRQRS